MLLESKAHRLVTIFKNLYVRAQFFYMYVNDVFITSKLFLRHNISKVLKFYKNTKVHTNQGASLSN